jgi:tetratricopeptide (TPR) repeat protein
MFVITLLKLKAMKNTLLIITLFFSSLILAQIKSSKENEKNKITANIYAIVIDGQNDFENFKGDLINLNNTVSIYKVKNQTDATKNFFTTTIKLDKSTYNMLNFESDDERGEFFFRIVEQTFEKLVTDDRLTKKEIKFPAGSQTKATTYYGVDGISPVAYIWYKSTNPVLRYSITICANERASVWVQTYVTANKISIPKPINSIAKTTAKSIQNGANLNDEKSKNSFLESLSIENIKKEESKPQFPTSHLQPNYIADQIDTSTLDGKDAVRSQNGYQAYDDLRFEAMILTLGLGKTKEVNPEKALALCNEAIRIFPNLHRAYVDRGQANYKLGNKIMAQNDFDKARQLAPFESKWIDKALADVEGREWVDPDRVTTTYEYSAPVNLYNYNNTEEGQEELKKQKAQAERTAKCICCLGTGVQEIKGRYLGNSTYSVTPVNGLGISHEESVATYGPSTYSPCSCCKIKD